VGLLVAIEGIDGSGKGTQAALLHRRLVESGRRAALLGFPRYSETFFGARIGDFLNGRFGRLDEVDPFLAATLYAGDRYESKGTLLDALAAHEVVVLDRYIPSNIAHQAGKRRGADRLRLRNWIEHLEYELYGLPRPDLVVLFDLPARDAAGLIALKKKRDYTDSAADLQEADTDYQESVRSAYLELSTGPEWRVVEVTRDGQVRPPEVIAAEVFEAVSRQIAGPR
jgi:dTMP kinase